MDVICLQDDAFYALVEEVVQRIKQAQNITEDKWISPEGAMNKHRINSKTNLAKITG